MIWRRFFLEAAALVVAAIACAAVSNAVASRERKLVVFPHRVRTATPPATTTGGLKPAAATSSSGLKPGSTSTVSPPLTATTAAPPPAPVPRAAKPEPAAAPKAPADTRQPAERFPPHPDKPYVELAFDDVKWLHDKGVVFLDARRTSVYEQGHIPGAQSYSVWESDIDDKVNKFYAEHSDPKDQNLPIVVYCSGGDCEDSHMLAQKLWGIQFNNVYVYKDGFPDWQKHGEPVHTGANP